ncbi:2721_t:CDS:1, partial [Dentiscutata erythropus]
MSKKIKKISIFKSKNHFHFTPQPGYCFFCLAKIKQGPFCNSHCEGFVANRHSHRQVRQELWQVRGASNYQEE